MDWDSENKVRWFCETRPKDYPLRLKRTPDRPFEWVLLPHCFTRLDDLLEQFAGSVMTIWHCPTTLCREDIDPSDDIQQYSK